MRGRQNEKERKRERVRGKRGMVGEREKESESESKSESESESERERQGERESVQKKPLLSLSGPSVLLTHELTDKHADASSFTSAVCLHHPPHSHTQQLHVQ